MADKRKILKKGESIRLYSEEKKAALTFTVTKKCSADNRKIVYTGELGKKKAMLIEMYPLTENAGELMVRGEDNCLLLPDEKKGSKALTKKEALSFAEDYTALKKHIKNARSKNEFADIIPEFDILRGCDKNGKAVGTAYILTEMPSDDFTGFDKFAKEMKSQAVKNPEKSVFSLLLFIYTLAGAVEFLHSGGFSLGAQTLADTVIPAKNGNFRIEAARLGSISNLIVSRNGDENADNSEFEEVCSADIRALGLMLFGALTKKDEIPRGEYSEECYNMLQSIIASAELLKGSPVTANYKLQNIIVNILKSSLAGERAKKVYDAAAMLAEIKSAAVFILPSEYTDETNLYKEIKNIDKKLDKYNEANAVFALQSLLFNYPLYLESKGDEIRVAVIGFGVYGQKFLDLCLQTGQIYGKSLDVTVVTLFKDVYKNEYLSSRPALADFFDIDTADSVEGNYGKITFIEPAALDERFRNGFSSDSPKLNRELIECISEKNGKPDYIFVSAGAPELNKRVAKSYMKYFSENNHKCLVSFVYPDKLRADERNKRLVPVNVNVKSSDTLNFDEIERMAFNVFLLYNTSLNLNTDFKEAKKKFRNPYDFNSSVACALAIKYKLYSLGIPLERLSLSDCKKAAAAYQEKITKNRELFAGLVQAEHARWVVEKITDGWKCRTNLRECLPDAVQNKRLKVHPCIVKSRADFLLEEKYTKNELWNEPNDLDDTLDELDRFSVELHRMFYQQANEKKNSFSLHSYQESVIRELIRNDKTAILAFNALMECLEGIWEFDEDAPKYYQRLKNDFLGSISGYASDLRTSIETNFNYIDMNAGTVIAACKMRDYKATDKLIIENIPFILTYKEDITMMVPLQTGSVTASFNNVAHAAMINPSEITYVINPENNLALTEATETLKCILPYFEKANIKTAVKLLFISNEKNLNLTKNIGKKIEEIRAADINSVITEIRSEHIEKNKQIAEKIEAECSGMDLYETNKTYLSAYLDGAGFYNSRASFTFVSGIKTFRANPAAEWVTYIKGAQALDVDDMFALRGAGRVSEKKNLSSSDYAVFWNQYTSNRWPWKAMCDSLSEYAQKNDKIAQFRIADKDDTQKEYVCIVPVEYRDGYRRLVRILCEDFGIIKDTSRVEYISLDSCKVIINASSKYSSAVNALFEHPERFVSDKNITFDSTENTVSVIYNNLTVTDCAVCSEKNKKHHNKVINIFEDLECNHFISNLKFENNNGTVSFRYASRQIKDIMTCEGRALELYVHNKLKKGNFDDVESDYKFRWDSTEDYEILSEMDCIVTKGFSSCIIESKATAELSQDYYFKLSALASRFGVNTIPVIVASDLHRSGTIYNTNKMQIERGRQLGVITVFMSPEIENIDKTIENILKGSYTQKTLAPFKK